MWKWLKFLYLFEVTLNLTKSKRVLILKNLLMRKIYTLFLLSFFSCAFSQTYQFDFLTKYSAENLTTKSIRESGTYNNTDDFSYYLKLKKTEDDFQASLYDYNKSLVHYFTVKETKVSVHLLKFYTISNIQFSEKLSLRICWNLCKRSKSGILKNIRFKKSKKTIFGKGIYFRKSK